ncbi:MAG TPA: hypothetical protein VN709_09865 [Terriglobales bacterium]|nr:hypothetical protein [Terriglobales bacterium]
MRTRFSALLAVALAIPVGAVSTHFWRSAGYQDLARGRLTGVELNPDGRLTLAPALAEVARTGQALIWTAVADASGNAYLGTGNRGEVYKLTPAMLAATSSSSAPAPLFTAAEPDVFALAVGPGGALFAGSSPNGKVYRIAPDGKSEVYFDPHANYIWGLAFLGPTLYVATGTGGEIYRVTAAGVGEKFLDTRQQQVTSLIADGRGNLLAGTESSNSNGGLVYRIAPSGKAEVLYHSDLAEIHALRLAANGDLYVTAQGEHAGGRPLFLPPAVAAPLATPAAATITMTVPAAAQSNMPETNVPANPAAAPSPSSPAPYVLSDTPPPAPAGAPISAIYRIATSGPSAGAVDTIWSSRQENADDVLPAASGLLVSTDNQGRIYRLAPAPGEATVVAQTRQAEATRLFQLGATTFVTTREQGNLYRMAQPEANGTYESPVRDTGAISRFGALTFTGAGSLELMTRSGNSALPDFTWSDWSAPYPRSGAAITSPRARYIQWKAVLASPASHLDQVVIPYLPANQPPQIASLTAETVATPDKSIDKGIKLQWTARDPDGDKLAYSLYFKGQGESAWKLLRPDLSGAAFTVTPAMLPDGSYAFRLVASDAGDNPASEAKTAEIISAPAIMDTAPPQVDLVSATPAAAHFRARSRYAPISQAEFAVDGGPWKPLLSDDGMLDSLEESFTVFAAGLSPGEHVLMLRVANESGNQGSAKAVVQIPVK